MGGRFADCSFQHVEAADLDAGQKALLLRDLRKRPYDKRLAPAIKQLNIPVRGGARGRFAELQGLRNYRHSGSASSPSLF